MHFEKQAQIRALLFNEVFTKVSIEYSNYNNIFLVKYIAKFPENTRINEYIIKQEEGKQSLFGFIYNLGLIELKTLKIYIKINLVNSFIQLFKSFIKAFILFNKKLDRNFCLYINYCFNNIIIKN